jgi:hypothetical protein
MRWGVDQESIGSVFYSSSLARVLVNGKSARHTEKENEKQLNWVVKSLRGKREQHITGDENAGEPETITNSYWSFSMAFARHVRRNVDVSECSVSQECIVHSTHSAEAPSASSKCFKAADELHLSKHLSGEARCCSLTAASVGSDTDSSDDDSEIEHERDSDSDSDRENEYESESEKEEENDDENESENEDEDEVENEHGSSNIQVSESASMPPGPSARARKRVRFAQRKRVVRKDTSRCTPSPGRAKRRRTLSSVASLANKLAKSAVSSNIQQTCPSSSDDDTPLLELAKLHRKTPPCNSSSGRTKRRRTPSSVTFASAASKVTKSAVSSNKQQTCPSSSGDDEPLLNSLPVPKLNELPVTRTRKTGKFA